MKVLAGIQPFVTLEIPVSTGWVRWLRPVPWYGRVAAAGARIAIHVPHDDSGLVDLRIGIANFGRRAVTAESVQITESVVGHSFVNFADPKLRQRSVVPPRGVVEIEIVAKIDGAGIRQLQQGSSVPPRNRYCSPAAPSRIKGWLEFSRGSARQSVEYAITDIAPFLNLYNPSSGASSGA